MDNVFGKFPRIKIGEYILDELRENHVRDFYAYINNSNVSKYLSSEDLPKSLVEAKEELLYWSKLFKYRSSVYWGITTKANKLIGTCGFNSWSKHQRRAELSYDLDFDFWNKGIMTRAIKTICDFAFKDMQVKRIQATIVTDNISSIKVLEKNGFLCEGTLFNYAYLNDKQLNSYMFSKTQN